MLIFILVLFGLCTWLILPDTKLLGRNEFKLGLDLKGGIHIAEHPQGPRGAGVDEVGGATGSDQPAPVLAHEGKRQAHVIPAKVGVDAQRDRAQQVERFHQAHVGNLIFLRRPPPGGKDQPALARKH